MEQRVPLNEKFKEIRQNLHFVLVEPETPGNIGSAARALKTCGFEKLVLVNPANLDHPELSWLAHNSMDIIEKATIVPTFADAIQDMKLVVGTTMRTRKYKFPIFNPREISDKLQTLALSYPVAIVFGRESSGLANDELFHCHMLSTIQTATQIPSLNLAQSVMIYAHTFFMHLNNVNEEHDYDLASHEEIEKYYDHLKKAMDQINFVPRDNPDGFLIRLRRLIGRAYPERRDIRLLHKLIRVFEERIDELETELARIDPDKVEQSKKKKM